MGISSFTAKGYDLQSWASLWLSAISSWVQIIDPDGFLEAGSLPGRD